MDNNKLITKSRFTCGDTCPYATINCLERPEDATPIMEYIADNGTDVGLFATKLYPKAYSISPHDTPYQRYNLTKWLIVFGDRPIFEASFLYENLFCAVDILEFSDPKHVVITEVKSATEIKDIFYRDVAFQVYVIQKCGYTVDAAYLMYVNKEYVRDGDLNPKQFFIKADITADVLNMLPSIGFEIEALESSEAHQPNISECCFKPYTCPFWDKVCKPTLPENSIFDIRGMRVSTKMKLYNSGTITMADFLTLKKQNEKYVQQCRMEVDKNDIPEVKIDELSNFMREIQFPITSLDFETVNEAIPLFTGQHPYEQTAFQFSMHVLRKYGGSLEHFEYIANPHTDWRVEIAHELVRCCPSDGSVLVWNDVMEKGRINDLAELDGNQDIREKLLSIVDRIVDLMVPFRNRVIYNRLMRGSYSIKNVLPALCPNEKNISYKDLAINNGMAASMAFSNLIHSSADKTLEDVQAVHSLLTYCALDTYGPFCILNEMLHLKDETSKPLFEKCEKRDNSNRGLLVGDVVSTNVGNGVVTGFTRCYTRVQLDAGYKVLRKPHNLYNINEFARANKSTIPTNESYRTSKKHVQDGDFVVTNSILGQVIGKTKYYYKVRLSNGKVVLRKENSMTIVSR